MIEKETWLLSVCIVALVEAVERSSSPAPVEVFPSNAGQDIGPTQAAGKPQSLVVF